VEKYPRHYSQHDSLPICPPKAIKEIPFKHTNHLVDLGEVPKVIIPNIDSGKTGVNAGGYEKVASRFPISSPTEQKGLDKQVSI
jgi:hypothetical protein